MKTKFRKKPVVIEAEQWKGSMESYHAILKLEKPGGRCIRTDSKSMINGFIQCLIIPTEEGDMLASLNDLYPA